MRLQVRATEICFLSRVAGLSLRDRVRSSPILEELGVEPMLLHVKRSEIRCLGLLVRMSGRCLPGEVQVTSHQ